MEPLVVVGNITHEVNPYPHFGGASAYSAVTANQLGLTSSVVTKCRLSEPYHKQLAGFGVHVLRPHGADDTITRLVVEYSGQRKRLRVTQRQSAIGLRDIAPLRHPHFDGSAYLVATTIDNEVEPEVLPFLAELGFLAVIPQGYFRRVSASGEIVPTRQTHFIDRLRHAQVVILGDEDITFGGRLDWELLELIRASCDIVVLTRGYSGSDIFLRGIDKIHVSAYPTVKLIDLTGAGDTYATAFVGYFRATGNVRGAGVFASLYASLKISGLGGGSTGMGTIPSLAQVRRYADGNPAVQAYLWANCVDELDFDLL